MRFDRPDFPVGCFYLEMKMSVFGNLYNTMGAYSNGNAAPDRKEKEFDTLRQANKRISVSPGDRVLFAGSGIGHGYAYSRTEGKAVEVASDSVKVEVFNSYKGPTERPYATWVPKFLITDRLEPLACSPADDAVVYFNRETQDVTVVYPGPPELRVQEPEISGSVGSIPVVPEAKDFTRQAEYLKYAQEVRDRKEASRESEVAASMRFVLDDLGDGSAG